MKERIPMDQGEIDKRANDIVELFVATKEKLYMEAIESNKDSQTSIDAKRKLVDKARDSAILVGLSSEDKDKIIETFEKYLCGYGDLQKYIDDEEISDIKVLDYDNTIVTKNGINICVPSAFSSLQDYKNFVRALCVRNQKSIAIIDSVQRFTDKSPKNFRLRVAISKEYVNCVDVPYLIIRKHPKVKREMDKLLELKMFDEVAMNILNKLAATSTGILISGRGGSGKTQLMNAMIEKIPHNMAIQVIQETDEIFPKPKAEGGHPNVMCNHIVKPSGESQISFKFADLAEQALLNRVDVIVIGELKGEESVSIKKASDTGHVCWASLHSKDAQHTIQRLDSLINEYFPNHKNGSVEGFEHVIYMQKYKVIEICRYDGYDKITGEYHYTSIYKREED